MILRAAHGALGAFLCLALALPMASLAASPALRSDQLGGTLLLGPGANAEQSGNAASADGPESDTRNVDPFEGFNRAVFKFNDALDKAVLRPVAKTYSEVVSPPWKQAIGNVFSNLADPWSGLNCLLQGKPVEAVTQIARFLINSTAGIVGLVDVATEMGLERSREDLGQTLGRWGIGPGPYLVLPFVGPSSVRDGLGFVVDRQYGDPVVMIDPAELSVGLQITRLVDTRASLLRAERVMESAALDRYLFVRNGYLQRRRNLVYDGNPPEVQE